jgi:hypothetical protein
MPENGNCYMYKIVDLQKFEEARKIDISTYEGLELQKITNPEGTKILQCKGHAENTDCDKCQYFEECIK